MIIQNSQSVIWTGWSDLRVSRLQSGCFRKPLSSTPEPCMSLVLRSRNLRWEGLDFRAEVRRPQLVTDKLQLTNLNKEQWRSKCIYIQFHESVCHCGSVDTHCPSVGTRDWPENFQPAVWTLQSSTELLHSWILQLTMTQVQLSEVGGVELQSWGHDFTVTVWEEAIRKPATKEGNTRSYSLGEHFCSRLRCELWPVSRGSF